MCIYQSIGILTLQAIFLCSVNYFVFQTLINLFKIIFQLIILFRRFIPPFPAKPLYSPYSFQTHIYLVICFEIFSDFFIIRCGTWRKKVDKIVFFLFSPPVYHLGAPDHQRPRSDRIHQIFNLKISAPRWKSGNHPKRSTSGL